MNSTFASPGGGKDKTGPRKAQNIVPVTIKQLLDSPDEHLKIEDIDVNTAVILGIVRRVETSTTKVTFLMDDNTGTIEAIHYVGTDGDGQAEPQTILMEGVYGKIMGALRCQRGTNQKYVVIYKVMPVRDMNEITVHGLECFQVPIKIRKVRQAEEMKAGFGDGAGMGNTYNNSSMVGGFANGDFGGQPFSDGGGGGLTTNQNKVLLFIKASTSESGVSRDEIEKNLRLPVNKISEILESLSGEGLIYSTIDDFHFRVTE